jgi:hypothetical protein
MMERPAQTPMGLMHPLCASIVSRPSPSLPRSDRKLELGLGIAGGVLLLVILVFAVIRGNEHHTTAPSGPPTLEDRCGEHLQRFECEHLMANRLKDPESAEFTGMFGDRVVTLGDCTQIFRSHVRSKNGLGLMVRTDFMCRYDPKTKKTTFSTLP